MGVSDTKSDTRSSGAARAEDTSHHDVRTVVEVPAQTDTKLLTNDVREILARAARTADLDLARLEALAAQNPGFPAELDSTVRTYWGTVGRVSFELRERVSAISSTRIKEGRYEDYDLAVKVPQLVPGEHVHTGVYYDPVNKKDVRRVVRVNPGDDSVVDRLQSEFDAHRQAAQQATTDCLARFERR